MEYNRFGGYNPSDTTINVQTTSRGKVLVHEVGHFFGLLHTFEGGCGTQKDSCHQQGDKCCDTPPVDFYNTNCTSGRNSCFGMNGLPDLADQTENYMDYAGEDCQNTFTRDQTRNMHFMLLYNRTALVDPAHINQLNLPCATFSAFHKPGSNTICQDDIVQLTALKYKDTTIATYYWTLIHPNETLSASGVNLYTFKFGFSEIGMYTSILRIEYGNSMVFDTLKNAVYVQDCGIIFPSEQGNWYFGQYAGLIFSSIGKPVVSDRALIGTGLNNSTINSNEGTVTQSTPDGRLLFYGGGKAEFGTNGIANKDSFYLYNKQHSKMPNGTLMGSSSSMQGGIILPKPGSLEKFYLLLTNQVSDYVLQDTKYRGLRWSLIDTTLDNGNGDVDSFYRNVPIKVPHGVEFANVFDSAVWTGEGVAAIPHCDGIRHWIVTGSGSDQKTNRLHVFLTDTNGVFYHHTDTMPITEYTYLTATASPDGNYICISGILFSFDRQYGKLNFLKSINDSLSYPNAYYSEFSPNSSILYSVAFINDSVPYLRQVDLRSSDYKYTDYKVKNTTRMPQLGPNGKIYLAQFDEGFLGVIDYPNNVNTIEKPNAFGYRQDAVSLNPNGTNMKSQASLPNMIDALPPGVLANSFYYSAEACNMYTFKPQIDCSDFYIWDFGDEDTAHGYSVNHTFTEEGEYIVTLYTDQDTLTKQIKIGIHVTTPTIVGPVVICDTSHRKSYSIIMPNTNFWDSISSFYWSTINGYLVSRNNTPSMEVKWKDEGTIKLIYKDNYQCLDSVYLDVVFADSAIYNNEIMKSDTLFCDSMEITTIAGTHPGGGSGSYTYSWFKSSSETGPWFQVFNEYNETLHSALPGYYYYRVVFSDGCEDISNLISPSTREITNNIITDSIENCDVVKLIGSIPKSFSGNFTYLWFVDIGDGPTELNNEILKDIVPYRTQADLYYFRQAKSGTCVTNSNIINVVNFNRSNTIHRYIPPLSPCQQTMNGSDMLSKFSSVTYQWQTSVDKQNWTIIDSNNAQNLNHYLLDTIVRFYRRIVTDSNCISISNIEESKSVKLAMQPHINNLCGHPLFPLRVMYEFDKPYYISGISKIWQFKKAGSSIWYSIENVSPDDTVTNIGELVTIISGGSDSLEIGDSLRLNYIYSCGNTYSFYSEKLVIDQDTDFYIVTHPRDTAIDAGHRAYFTVQVTYPEECNFRWQYSQTGTNGWLDLSDRYRDTLITLGGGCADTNYYRAKILAPCDTFYSDPARLVVTGANPTFDYWIKDQWQDTGREKNLDSNELVKSPDIWVRYKRDGIKKHQTASTFVDTNWVYVTIRNRGTEYTRHAKLYLYWSWGSTGEWWDRNWTYNSNNNYINISTYNSHSMGGEINKTGYSIDSIAPGDSIRVAIPWPYSEVPKLNWYDLNSTFWKDKINICYLARIETCDIPQFGMSHIELENVRQNAQNNNNIAIRNSFVARLFPPETTNGNNNHDQSKPNLENIVSGGVIRIRNGNSSENIKVCVKIYQSSYLSKANVYLELGEELYSQWIDGGSVSSGLVYVSDRIFKVTSLDACLSNLSVSSGFQDNIRFLFGYINLNNRFTDEDLFNVSVVQYNEDNQLVGECTFEVSDNAFTSQNILTFSDTLVACDFDEIGGYVLYNAPCADLNYTIWDVANEEFIILNEYDKYYLTPGEYLFECDDYLNAQLKRTFLTVTSTMSEVFNYTDTVMYNCDRADSAIFSPSQCTGGSLYDVFEQLVTPYSPNLYYLDAENNNMFTYYCSDTNNCVNYSATITLLDSVKAQAATFNYHTGDYDRSLNPCCFIDLTAALCESEPSLAFGQQVDIFDMTPTWLYSTNLEMYGGSTVGFWFCPPIWNTNLSSINDWYRIIVKNDVCSYCRIDFYCDSISDPLPIIMPFDQKPSPNESEVERLARIRMILSQQSDSNSNKQAIVQAYPNPASSILTLEGKNLDVKNISVRFFNSNGAEVFIMNIDTKDGKLKENMDISTYADGIYTLYIPEINYTTRILIIH